MLDTEDDIDAILQSVLAAYNLKGVKKSPVGVTGDLNVPYRDWRGSPLEVGTNIIYPSMGYGSSVDMIEAEILEITYLSPGVKARSPWNFSMVVKPLRAAGGGYRSTSINANANKPNPWIKDKVKITKTERVTAIYG